MMKDIHLSELVISYQDWSVATQEYQPACDSGDTHMMLRSIKVSQFLLVP